MEVYTSPVGSTTGMLIQILNAIMIVVPAVIGVIILVLVIKALRKHLREKETADPSLNARDENGKMEAGGGTNVEEGRTGSERVQNL